MGVGFEQDPAGNFFHHANDRGQLLFVPHGLFHLVELIGGQSDGHGFARHLARPLVADSSPASSGAVLHRTLADVTHLGEFFAPAGILALQPEQ